MAITPVYTKKLTVPVLMPGQVDQVEFTVNGVRISMPANPSGKFGDCLAGGGYVTSIFDGAWHHYCHEGSNDGDEWGG
jgi:hypothetical protein